MTFSLAVARTIEREGGFTNDPLDPGGATRYGITLTTLSLWKRKPASVEDVKKLSVNEAVRIYKALWWDAMGLDALPPKIAAVVFDAGVLFGQHTAAAALQKTLVNLGASLEVDGHIGPKTANAAGLVSPKLFFPAYVGTLLDRINAIIERRPTSQKYRKGWERRVKEYPVI